jgi:hypothetical protein
MMRAMGMPWGGRRVMALRAAMLYPGVRCHLCGEPIAHVAEGEIDHLVPRSMGGDDGPRNLAPAHRRCNRVRGDKPRPFVSAPPARIAMPASPSPGASDGADDAAGS